MGEAEAPVLAAAAEAQGVAEAAPAGEIVQATAPPTQAPAPTSTSFKPTLLPPPEVTSLPTSAPTTTVTPTMTETVAPTQTPRPSPTTEPDRYCPETTPLKPEYDRFYLSPEKWPEPDEALASAHFWLSNPLTGAGRALINQRFPYGWDENGRLLLHTGVDMAEDLGTELLAVADGTVVVAQSDYSAWYGWRCDWYGHLVVIELDDRWNDLPVYALYGHVLSIKVEPGQRVQRGEPVAEVGVGGAATNPHLHFEVRVGENEFSDTRNPMLWIDPGPTRGVIAGRLVDPEGRPWQGVPLALLSADKSENILGTWSYLGDPQGLMNPDEGFAENFVFDDVPPGDYIVTTQIQGVNYEVPVQAAVGDVARVQIATESLKTPTAEAQPDIPPTASSTPEPY